MAYVEYEADGKTIKARVWQKVDTLANWEANSLVIGPGEQAFVIDGAGTPINFKIGDGTKKFSELPWWISYDQGQYVQVVGNALPTPTVELGYSFVGPGTYTHAGGDVVAPDGRFSQIVFEGGSWSLKDMGALPQATGVDVLNPEGEALPKEKAVAGWVKPETVEVEELENLIAGIQPTNGYVRSNGTIALTNTWRKIEFPVSDKDYLFDSKDMIPNANKYIVIHDENGLPVAGTLKQILTLPHSFSGTPTGVKGYICIKDPNEPNIPQDLVLTSTETTTSEYISKLFDKPIIASLVKDSQGFQEQILGRILVSPNFDVTRRMTFGQLKNAIATSSLKVGENIVVTGGPGGHTMLVSANSENSISKSIQVPTLDYDYYKLDIDTNKILAYDNISCIARNTDGVWGLINNSGHVPKGFASITAPNGTQFRITYSKNYTKVISLVACSDETYVAKSICSGPSVGLTYSDFNSSTAQGIFGQISESEGNLTIDDSGFQNAIKTVSFNAANGNITIVHSTINSLSGIGILTKNPLHRPVLVNSAINSIVFRMHDNSGNVIMSPTGMAFQISRLGSRVLNNEEMAIAGANVWIQGLMMTEFS